MRSGVCRPADRRREPRRRSPQVRRRVPLLQSASAPSVPTGMPARDLGEQAVAVADDGRRTAVQIGPALAQQGQRDGVERAGLDVVADTGPPQSAT